MQKVRRSLKRGAGPRTTLLTGSGYKRYHTKRKARRNGHEGEPRECLQPAFTARSSSISMRQNTIERDQPGAERTNFANIYSKKRKIIPVWSDERRLVKTDLSLFKPSSHNYTQGSSARLSTKAKLAREGSVGVRIIAETKVGMGRP